MWAFALRFRAAHLNEMIVPWRISGPLDPGALRAALTDVTRRHPTLRARLSYHAGQLYQVVLPCTDVELPLIEVDAPSPDRRLQAALDIVNDENRTPLDVIAGPTLVSRLIRLAPEDHVLCLYIHHAMCDGWSLQIILRDLATFYQCRRDGTPANLPPLAEQYADAARWETSNYEAGGFDDEIRYWQEELRDPPPPIALPAIAARKGNRDWRAGTAEVVRSGQHWRALSDLARRLRVSPFALCLSAFVALLRQRTGLEDMVLGVPTLNRWSEQSMCYVGYVTSLMPLRLRPRGTLGFDALCVQVHGSVRTMLANGRVPLELLLRETPLAPSGHTVFPIWCQLQEGGYATPFEAAGLRFESLATERKSMLAELDVDLFSSDQAWRCEFGYRTALFEPAAVQGMLHDYLRLLDWAQTEPSQSVAALSARLT